MGGAGFDDFFDLYEKVFFLIQCYGPSRSSFFLKKSRAISNMFLLEKRNFIDFKKDTSR